MRPAAQYQKPFLKDGSFIFDFIQYSTYLYKKQIGGLPRAAGDFAALLLNALFGVSGEAKTVLSAALWWGSVIEIIAEKPLLSIVCGFFSPQPAVSNQVHGKISENRVWAEKIFYLSRRWVALFQGRHWTGMLQQKIPVLLPRLQVELPGDADTLPFLWTSKEDENPMGKAPDAVAISDRRVRPWFILLKPFLHERIQQYWSYM